jgi:hypothetical protein
MKRREVRVRILTPDEIEYFKKKYQMRRSLRYRLEIFYRRCKDWWQGVRIEIGETFKVRIPSWWRQQGRYWAKILTYQPGRGDGGGRWK